MDAEFIMGRSDGLERTRVELEAETWLSPELRARLTAAAIRKSVQFFSEFLAAPRSTIDWIDLGKRYQHVHDDAIALGLFEQGGVEAKDHLNFWCLGQVLRPAVYVESGVFIGSSLHAFLGAPSLRRCIGIDPDLSNLKIPVDRRARLELIDELDFSQLDLDFGGQDALVYFDDHIDTAKRIVEASEKGLRLLVFDDSPGLEGTCQRLYPAIPTIPMIVNAELFAPGDRLAWTFSHPNGRLLRVALTVDRAMVEKMAHARSLIRKHAALPDPGEFLPQQKPHKTPDSTKYIVELEGT